MISKEDIQLAHQRIETYVHRTPVFTSQQLNTLVGAELYFKCENLQKVGAFKARGAFNFVLQIEADKLPFGVCTHSSGNHAQALALAAQQMNIPAYIVMPKNAPQVKVDAVRGYGANIYFCEPTLEARESKLGEIQLKTKATFVHPYNHENIIAGAATSAKELIEEVSNLDQIITPVGGGGLLAGTLLSAHYFGNNIMTYGGEPTGADDAKKSIDLGEIVPSHQPNTIADGLLTSLGEINFEIIKNHVKDILLVDDRETAQSMKLIWERLKLIVEPSSAVTLASIIKNKHLFQNKKIGLILSGGNVDLNRSYF